jgi:hypothetical protein
MDYINIFITLVTGLIGTAAGYFLKYYLDKKSEIENREYRAKEAKYLRLLDLARVY